MAVSTPAPAHNATTPPRGCETPDRAPPPRGIAGPVRAATPSRLAPALARVSRVAPPPPRGRAGAHPRQELRALQKSRARRRRRRRRQQRRQRRRLLPRCFCRAPTPTVLRSRPRRPRTPPSPRPRCPWHRQRPMRLPKRRSPLSCGPGSGSRACPDLQPWALPLPVAIDPAAATQQHHSRAMR